MGAIRSGRNRQLEEKALAFLSRTETPPASVRYSEYGARRVWAEAETRRAGKARVAGRRTLRNPALLYRTVVVILVVVAVLLASTTGVYALSRDVQPDSPLYGAKIFFERARIVFTISSTEDIVLEMRYSERRLDELRKMVETGEQRGADRWLREYGRNIEGAGMLFEKISPQDTERLSPRFQELLENHARAMEEMRRGEPSTLQHSLEEAYVLCDRERARMRQRCGQRESGDPLREPGEQHGDGECTTAGESTKQAEGFESSRVESTQYESTTRDTYPDQGISPGPYPQQSASDLPRSGYSPDGGDQGGENTGGWETGWHGHHIP